VLEIVLLLQVPGIEAIGNFKLNTFIHKLIEMSFIDVYY